MNRQFISNIRKITENLPPPSDPLIHYAKQFGQDDRHFTFQEITMSQLRQVLSKLRPTKSASSDDITVKAIKMASRTVEPLLLKLTNLIIKTGQFPDCLKTTKVVPIRKEPKPETSIEGWRPINIVCSISKVIEKTLLTQILKYLDRHKIVPHSHHGSVSRKSTQSLIAELHDSLLNDLNDDTETALIVLDQSKAYNLVCHQILMQKFKILGFNTKALETVRNYLENRKQFVEIQGFQSDNLLVRPRSVTQGSTLSGIFYLIFILDLPRIFHNEPHTPEEMSKCPNKNLKTFIDDNFIKVKRLKDKNIKQSIMETMTKVKIYMDSNRLKLNSSKSRIMMISSHQEAKREFEIQIEGKTIYHSPKLKLLGNVMTDNLSWNTHVRQVVLPSIRNTIRSLKITTKYLDRKFRQMYVNSLYRSRLLFAIETWGVQIRCGYTNYNRYKIRLVNCH